MNKISPLHCPVGLSGCLPGGAPAGGYEAGRAGHTEEVALPLVLVVLQNGEVETVVQPHQARLGTVNTTLPQFQLSILIFIPTSL